MSISTTTRSTLYAGIAERLSRYVRLIVWDKRGTGLSDPVTHVPPIDERMDDLRAVLDAAEVEFPALFGVSEGGPMSLVFAATYPGAGALAGARGLDGEVFPGPTGSPVGTHPGTIRRGSRRSRKPLGRRSFGELLLRADRRRAGCSRDVGQGTAGVRQPDDGAHDVAGGGEIDVRGVLDSVRTPTLVLDAGGTASRRSSPPQSSQRESRTPNYGSCRRANTTPSTWSSCFREAVLEFVGQQADAEPAERVLSTVLFTDIVGSTELLAARGDEHWRRALDDHDRLVDNVLSRYGGRRAKHTGDGVFALFDGPTKAARCGLDLVPALATHGIPIRAGVHIGECEKRGDEWSGMAVHVGARIGAMAGAGEVLTSRTVRDLSAGSGLVFEGLGLHRLKGLPEDTEVFRVKVA